MISTGTLLHNDGDDDNETMLSLEVSYGKTNAGATRIKYHTVLYK